MDSKTCFGTPRGVAVEGRLAESEARGGGGERIAQGCPGKCVSESSIGRPWAKDRTLERNRSLLGGDREPRISWAVQAGSGLGAIPVTNTEIDQAGTRDGGTAVIRNSPGQVGCDALGTFTAVGGIIDGDPMPRRRAAKPPVSPFQHQLGARTWFGFGGFPC